MFSYLHLPYPSLWQPPFYSLFLWVWLFFILIAHISDNVPYVSISVWIISFSIIPSSFIHLVINVRISFFFNTIVRLYSSFFLVGSVWPAVGFCRLKVHNPFSLPLSLRERCVLTNHRNWETLPQSCMPPMPHLPSRCHCPAPLRPELRPRAQHRGSKNGPTHSLPLPSFLSQPIFPSSLAAWTSTTHTVLEASHWLSQQIIGPSRRKKPVTFLHGPL